MSFDFGKYKKIPQTVKIEPSKAKKITPTPILPQKNYLVNPLKYRLQ